MESHRFFPNPIFLLRWTSPQATVQAMPESEPSQRILLLQRFQRQHRTGILTLLFTDLVNSTRLKQQLGDSRAVNLIQEHHAQVRQWLQQFPDAQEIETAGDSFLLVFARPSDAVRFALGLHARNQQLSGETKAQIEDRIGVHTGEVFVQEHGGGAKLFGSQLDLCGRVVNLAQGGQTLLTRFVFDNARAVLKGSGVAEVATLSWTNHGPYLFKGFEEAVEVCEVGEAGRLPLGAPKTSEKAQRCGPATFAGTDDDPSGGPREPRHALVPSPIPAATSTVAATEVRARGTTPPASIGVLPFVNMSADPENEFLSDGITEDLITALSRVPGLRVPARTSAFVFKGKTEDIRAIGQKLNVETVLEGSLRQAGRRLRVTAQLINVSDGFHLWSERYDREMADVFAIQDEINEAIVGALKVRLTGQADRAPTKRYTPHADIYQLYLKSRFCISKLTQEGLHRGMQLLEDAMRLEPDYPMPFVSQAVAYFTLVLFGHLPPKEGMPKSQAAARRALELDNTIAEAHTQLALTRFMFDWDWPGAEREFLRALELDPNSAETHHWYGMFLWGMTRYEESLREARRAIELDPLSLLFEMDLGFPLISLQRHREAIEQADRLISLEPDFWGGYRLRALARVSCGRRAEAIPDLEKAVALGGGPFMVAHLSSALARTGRTAEAQRLLDQLLHPIARQYTPAFAWVILYARNGDQEQFLAWWHRAMEERDPFLSSVKAIAQGWFPDNPLVPELLKKIGL